MAVSAAVPVASVQVASTVSAGVTVSVGVDWSRVIATTSAVGGFCDSLVKDS